MSIRSRLQKLENVTNINSEFCNCFGLRTEFYLQLSEGKEPELISPTISGICAKCRKPIEKEMIIIEAI